MLHDLPRPKYQIPRTRALPLLAVHPRHELQALRIGGRGAADGGADGREAVEAFGVAVLAARVRRALPVARG